MAFERYIDTVLMSVLFLEGYRHNLLKKEKSYKQQTQIKNIRIHGLIEKLRGETEREGADYLVEITRRKNAGDELENTLRLFLQSA
ncbi:MAG TPA: hypothetical protein DC049_01515 [Spirochaetia bacterium]|nr:hypothetical protein [Spirochaetia bacterium]